MANPRLGPNLGNVTRGNWKGIQKGTKCPRSGHRLAPTHGQLRSWQFGIRGFSAQEQARVKADSLTPAFP
jgi:hypothetical protein